MLVESLKPNVIQVNFKCVCVGCRGLRPGRHLEDDDIVPELAHIHPRERPDWEETISAMVSSLTYQYEDSLYKSYHWGPIVLYVLFLPLSACTVFKFPIVTRPNNNLQASNLHAEIISLL